MLPTAEEISPVIQLKLMATGIGTPRRRPERQAPGPERRGRRERPPYLRGAYRRPHPQDPAEVPRPIPSPSARPTPASRPGWTPISATWTLPGTPGAAHPHPAHGLPRAGSHPVPARRRRPLRDAPCSAPTGWPTACSTIPPPTSAPPRAPSTWPTWAFPSPADKKVVPKAVFARLLYRGPASARRAPGAALHLRHQGHGVGRQRLRLPVPAAHHQPRGPGPPRLQGHGDPLLRPRQPRLQPRLRGEHLRQCRRSLPARERRGAGPGAFLRHHRLRDPGPPPRRAAQEGPGPAEGLRGHGAAEEARHVLDRYRTSSTTRARPSRPRCAPPTASSSPSSPTTTSAIARRR